MLQEETNSQDTNKEFDLILTQHITGVGPQIVGDPKIVGQL